MAHLTLSYLSRLLNLEIIPVNRHLRSYKAIGVKLVQIKVRYYDSDFQKDS